MMSGRRPRPLARLGGEARGEIKGTLKTLISLYLDGIIPREIATTKSGLPESEFLAAADDFKNGKI